ncbi:monooxygenase [Obba rivulosa]|uniref:Monooxygenase n=1 Tax=Obba rivulosa TaxID=1052685 RepID=A0A8E2AHD5_9APHY|nr:monooxygenase [Obba rivulosa]
MPTMVVQMSSPFETRAQFHSICTLFNIATFHMTTSTPILIVGAGPAGLVLALSLLQNGVPVRIIDKAPEYHVGRRGRGIQPRTLEVFHMLGALPEILASSSEDHVTRVYKLPGGTEIVKEFTRTNPADPTPATPYPNPRSLGQEQTEAILRDHLSKYNGRVELNTELLSFEQYPDRVSARIAKHADGVDTEETVDCHYLVGTDGGKGIVRKQLGLSFLGETREDQHIVVADLQLKGIDHHFGHQWGDVATKFCSLRPPENDDYWTLLGAGQIDHAKIVADRDELIAFVRAVTDRDDIEVGHVKWISEFRPNIRMVDKFGEGRVFVAGDAAHVHPPTGGQGLNSSVQDSFNLGWKLALVEKGLATPALLETYTEERLPVIAEMLKKSTDLLNKTVARASSTAASARGGALRQLGVNYRWSPIVVDEGAEAEGVSGQPVAAYGDASGVLHAGDRAPDATGLHKIKGPEMVDTDTSLFRIFGSSHHTALVFATSAEEANAALGSLAEYPTEVIRAVLVLPAGAPLPAVDAEVVLEDRDGHAYAGYGAKQGRLTIAIVRPDGYVGALVHGAQGVENYFDRIFACLTA